MTGIKEILSDDVRHQVEELARAENREPADVLEEAVRRYAAGRRLDLLQGKLGERAKNLGIRESDVPELVHQVRDENQRGR